jgi:hypothetical protein
MAGSKASICGQSCCGAIARSLIEPEGFEGERPWVKGVAWGCEEVCTGCTDFGRFSYVPVGRGAISQAHWDVGALRVHRDRLKPAHT